MENRITLDRGRRVFPIIMMILGIAAGALLLIFRLNLFAVISVGYCCLAAAIILLELIIRKKVYSKEIYGYSSAMAGVIIYYVILGADAGFGAFMSGKAGFSSAEHPLLTGGGNFFTRLLGNILIALPVCLCLWGLYFVAKKRLKKIFRKEYSPVF
jgi:hypothetical protein